MILETKYNIGDKVWFMSYRKKKIIEAPVMAIEINVRYEKTAIRYQVVSDNVKSYFYEFQVFSTEQEAVHVCFQPSLN